MPTVSPTDPASTHHIQLSTGYFILCDSRGNASEYAIRQDPMPRMSLKMYGGDSKWDDTEPPWTPLGQSDWSGGRGAYDFESDKSRYGDGHGVDTTRAEQIVLGGQPVYVTGMNKNWPSCTAAGAALTYVPIILCATDGARYVAQKFTTTSAHSVKYIHLIVKYEAAASGSNLGNLTVHIYSDSSGEPGTSAGSTTITTSDVIGQGIWTEVFATFSSAVSLSNATSYWVVLDGSATTTKAHWAVLGESGYAATNNKTSTNATKWDAGSANLFYRTKAARIVRTSKLFRYKGSVHYLGDAAGTMAMVLYGEQGVATGGTTTTLIDSTKTWADDEFNGCIVRLLAGTGSNQRQAWAQITDTDNATDTITFTPALDVAPSTDTEYVIVACNKASSIGTHGLTAPVTDVLVAGEWVYFGMGDGVVVRRMNSYNNAGTWTRRYDDEAAATYGYYLCAAVDTSGPAIWRAERLTGAIDRADQVTTWTDLTWDGEIVVGNYGDKINGLNVYEDGALWVFKESGVYKIINSVPYWVPSNEMETVTDYRNGLASAMHQVYLYWSMHNGLARYYNGSMDSVGPDLDEGLPINRRGNISALEPYPGRLYAAVDAGENGYSSVLCWNGLGWCEVYRAPKTGWEIRNLLVESIPGEHVDRLWIVCGDDVLWIPIAQDPYRNYKSTSITYNFYNYKWGGVIDSAFMFAGFRDVQKYYHSLTVINDNYAASHTVVGYYGKLTSSSSGTISYAIGGDSDPHGTSYNYNAITDTNYFSQSYNITGYGLRTRLIMETTSNQSTPHIVAAVTDTAIRLPVKYVWSIVFRVKENDVDLLGNPDTVTASTKLSALATLDDLTYPVQVTSTNSQLNGKYVFLDSWTMRPYYNTPDESGFIEGWICQAQLIEAS